MLVKFRFKNKFWLLLILLIIIFSFSALASTGLHYYRFNDNLADDGINPKNLTGVNTPFNYITGKVNNAVDLEVGSSQYAYNYSINDANSIRTVDFWVNLESIDPNEAGGFAIRKDNTHVLRVGFGDGNKIAAAFYEIESGYIWQLFSTTTLSTGTWFHVILTFGSGGAKLYINGNTIPEANLSDTTVMSSDYTQLIVGATRAESEPRFHDGLIDNMYFADWEYTTADVTYSWNGGAGRDFLYAPDTTPPTFSNAKNGSANFRMGENFTANITINDTVALDYYIFATNASGSWQNDTIDISGTTYLANATKTISLPKNNQVCWYFWANDTNRNSNRSDYYCFTVANTPPTIDSLYPDDNDHDFLNLTVNFTYSDADNDVGECSFYINGSLEETQSSIADNTLVNFTKGFTVNESHYNWTVICNDSIDFTNKSRLFVLDRINPIIEGVNPSEDNTTISNQDITLDITCSDANLYLLWVNVSNSTGTLIYSKSYGPATETSLTANDFIDLTVEGIYTVAITCSDQHTAEAITCP